METTLRLDSIKINAADEELYRLIINISTGKIHFEEIVSWLKDNTTTL
jgi:prophage maintenance system killer protein